MKSKLLLLTAAILGGWLACPVEAAKPTPSPLKRTLEPLTIQLISDEGPLEIEVTGDCDSENANIEYNVAVTVRYTLPDDATVYSASGKTEVEHSIALAKEDTSAPIDGTCDRTVGSTIFQCDEIEAAIDAVVAGLVPAGGTPDGMVEIDAEWVDAKAWTTSNSVRDSRPSRLSVVACD